MNGDHTDIPADLRTWPQRLADIARIVGVRHALVLAEALGGVATYIPKHPGQDHPLVQLIGLESARALARVYGGMELGIPRGTFRNLKKTAIMDATGSRRQVALALGVSERYVRKVANATKAAADAQPDLFMPPSKPR